MAGNERNGWCKQGRKTLKKHYLCIYYCKVREGRDTAAHVWHTADIQSMLNEYYKRFGVNDIVPHLCFSNRTRQGSRDISLGGYTEGLILAIRVGGHNTSDRLWARDALLSRPLQDSPAGAAQSWKRQRSKQPGEKSRRREGSGRRAPLHRFARLT